MTKKKRSKKTSKKSGNWDLIIYSDDDQKNVTNRFRISEKQMTAEGQHGKATILVDEKGKEWLVKVFSNIIVIILQDK